MRLTRNVRRAEGEPENRLGRIGDSMCRVLEGLGPEARDVRAIVLLRSRNQGGMVLNGYADEDDAIIDILGQLEALLASHGKRVRIDLVEEGPASVG